MRRSTEQFDDTYLINGIRNANKQAFTDLFDTYYVSLVMFCGTYINDLEQCRDIVSEVFASLWTKGRDLVIDKSLKAYLLRMVRNRALNEIRHRKVIEEHIKDTLKDGILSSHDVDNYVLYTEMKTRLEKTVASMPEKVGQAFRCYIEEGMKSKDIALVQKVSQRTVELRINKAFEILRHSLLILAVLIMI